MRGGLARMSRGGPAVRPSNEATARTYSLVAPYDGWNARGNLASMKPTEAIQMDNIFPGIQDVEIRKGCIDWATGAPSTIHSFLPYSGLTTNKLFAATNGNIYDVTANGAIGAAVVGCSNGFWQSTMMATAGGNFLFAVNGSDLAKTYDGAAWAIPAITVADSSKWSAVVIHKKRLWAVEQNTMDIWYLPVDSIAGAAAKFPVGSLFKKGGSVLYLGTWTIDGGQGIDDLFVIVTTNGEIAVYQGTDPTASATWALVGVYDVARPVGQAPLYAYGGDLLYLNVNGLLPLSVLRQSSIVDQASQISFVIDGAFASAADNYGINLGWQIITHKSANLLMVNIPVSQDTVSYQFVMNTTTKRWCQFTGWNASCWANFNGELYFALGTKVSKAWTGVTDAGVPIVGTVLQAYSALGAKGQKNVSLVRPNIGLAGSAQISLALDADFKTFDGQTIFTYSPGSTGAIWDTSLWDTGLWDGGSSIFEPRWQTVPGMLGYLHSFRLQITTSSGNFIWTSTDFAHRGAGIL
jgi:hypothetical protein